MTNKTIAEPEMFYIDIPDFFRIGIPVADKDARERALINLRWVLNCWFAAIERSYAAQAPRLLEVQAKCKQICDALKEHLTTDEYDDLSIGLDQ